MNGLGVSQNPHVCGGVGCCVCNITYLSSTQRKKKNTVVGGAVSVAVAYLRAFNSWNKTRKARERERRTMVNTNILKMAMKRGRDL